jgi:hypothetical protein
MNCLVFHVPFRSRELNAICQGVANPCRAEMSLRSRVIEPAWL